MRRKIDANSANPIYTEINSITSNLRAAAADLGCR